MRPSRLRAQRSTAYTNGRLWRPLRWRVPRASAPSIPDEHEKCDRLAAKWNSYAALPAANNFVLARARQIEGRLMAIEIAVALARLGDSDELCARCRWPRNARAAAPTRQKLLSEGWRQGHATGIRRWLTAERRLLTLIVPRALQARLNSPSGNSASKGRCDVAD